MDEIKQLILDSFMQMFPDAHCELVFNSDFELLVAVILSAQTTDVSVNKVTKKLFLKYKSPQDFVNTDLCEIENDIKNLGLYKVKARNIQNMSRMLIESFNSQVPNKLEDLIKLPGVGRKTANVVLSVAFNIPSFAVDTHVFRVSKRLNIAKDNEKVNDVEKRLMEYFPKSLWNQLHHQMIFFGRYHCMARNPRCENCPLTSICNYYRINEK